MTDEVLVRSFCEGDENSISTIFQKCYGRYSGYVPRTPQFWRWFNLSRPGVEASDVLVATRNDSVVGCLTLCSAGGISDPCYDPDLDGAMIVSALLEKAQDLAIGKGIKNITLNAPIDDACISSACRSLHMRQRKPDRVISASVINWHLFFPRLLSVCSPPDGNYQLSIRGRKGVELCISVKTGNAMIVDSPEEGRLSVRIKIEERMLVKAIFSEGVGVLDWMGGGISVSPIRKFTHALRFIKSLNLDLKIFLPRGGAF